MSVIVLTLILCETWPPSDLSESRNYLCLGVCGKEEKEWNVKVCLNGFPVCMLRQFVSEGLDTELRSFFMLESGHIHYFVNEFLIHETLCVICGGNE